MGRTGRRVRGTPVAGEIEGQVPVCQERCEWGRRDYLFLTTVIRLKSVRREKLRVAEAKVAEQTSAEEEEVYLPGTAAKSD